MNVKRMTFEDIQLVVFDFDGVFTNNQVLVSDTGQESVLCNRSDGLGLSRLRKLGIPMFVLSTEVNPVVRERCKKLKIECFHGYEDKLQKLEQLLQEKGISKEKTVYLGNDINDLNCLRTVGYPVVVADAYPEVIEVAQFVTAKHGGYGAVRELCDLIAHDIEQHKS